MKAIQPFAKKQIKNNCARLIKLIDLNAPDDILFNKVKNLVKLCSEDYTVVKLPISRAQLRIINSIMKNFKLICFEKHGSRWYFLIEFKDVRQAIYLKEKHDWPILINQDLKLVEKWLFKNYFNLVKLAFGYIT